MTNLRLNVTGRPWRSAMCRWLPPGLLGRIAGATGALAVAAFGSQPAFAAEQARDANRPMPPLARASPNHPQLPVSACRLWQLALMLHAAGVGAFGTQGLLGARATARRADNRGLRGDLDRRLLGAVPVVNQNVVCPPPCFFWPALPAPALSCQSGSSRRVVSCQKMTQGIGLGMGEALAAGGRTAPPQLHHVP